MKKLLVYLSVLCLLWTNLHAVEDRSQNFGSINIYKSDNEIVVKDILTAEEAIETLQDVVYLLETSYIDFDVIEERGFDKEAFIKNGEELFRKENQIKTEKVYDYICKSFEPYVNDSHFSISYMDYWKQLVCMKVIYLTETYVKKTEKGYKVVKSVKMPLGTELNLSEENLFKTILNGKELYRVGVLAQGEREGSVKNLPVPVNNKKILFNCAYSPEYFSSNEFEFLETKNTAYINIPMMDVSAEHFKHFNECAEKCLTKRNIIIDLRQNPGGDDSYFLDFLYFLYYGEKEKNEYNLQDFEKFISNSETKYINSSLIMQQLKMWTDYYIENGLDSEPIESLMEKPMGISYEENQNNNKRKEGKFTGNIIFLTSKNTASSAEDIIIDAKMLFDNVFLIGTNTMGCIRNADNYVYRLKNSGIKIQAGSVQWIREFALEEGVGFLPDYIVNGNLEETIRFLTKDKKIAKAVAEIN